MLARIDSAAVLGIEAYIVAVEVDLHSTSSPPSITIVGLGDAAVQESKERVRSAIQNSSFDFPAQHRLTINLAPADTRKEGPGFDLPLALGILAASRQMEPAPADKFAAIGELSLDGTVNAVTGVLPMALGARAAGKEYVIVPAANAAEAAVVSGLDVYGVEDLDHAVAFLNGEISLEPTAARISDDVLEAPDYEVDFSDVKGQEHVKRALEVAAAGGHNALMIGPPGSGKTMLARRMPTILPPLSLEEALETTKLYSVSGLLPRGVSLITTRTFRAPHHTVSNAGLIGGGTIPRPGEVSLAHHGVLFLDELPEFHRDALEVLRQPLEDGVVTIARAAMSLTFPARFMMIGAMNPCPCGYSMDAARQCHCTPRQIRSYLMRISGPLLDRIDLHVEVPRLRQDELLEDPEGEPSAIMRQRVRAAREVQQQRFAGSGTMCNAGMTPAQLREYCAVSPGVAEMLKSAIQQFNLSARAFDRILKVARTIADLNGSAEVEVGHAAEAIQYRSLDRRLWN